MTRVRRPPDINQAVKALERRTVLMDQQPAYDPDILPGVPTGLAIVFVLREQKHAPQYHAKFSWNPFTVGACEADVEHYVIQFRPVVFDTQTAVFGEKKTVKLDAKPFIEDAVNPYYIERALPRPKKWTWEFRVRIVNKGLIKGPFSAWFRASAVPSVDSRPKPPTPTGVFQTFDRNEKGRYIKFRDKVTWDEVGPWDVPGGDKEDDVDRYVCQIRRTDSAGTPILDAAGKQIRRTKKIEAKDEDANTVAFAKFGIHNKFHWWQARVRSIDRFNRRSDWSAWTPQARPTDTTPPSAPINVVGLAGTNRVVLIWDDPPHAEDPDLPDEDVVFYQVQASQGAGSRFFATIWAKDMFISGNRRGFVTKEYKKNHWLRARSVDAAGNKSAWVKRGPVRPLQAAANKSSDPDTVLIDEDDVSLVEVVTNSAYHVSAVAARRTATVDGEGLDGTLEGEIALSPTTGRANAGVVLRGQSTSEYLFATLDTNANQLILGKWTGAAATLASWTDPGFTSGIKFVEPGNTVRLTIVIDNDPTTSRTRIRIWVNDPDQGGAAKITHVLSTTDETTFNGSTNTLVGMYINRGTGLGTDDGLTSWGFVQYFTQGDPADDGPSFIYDDNFNRAASATSLGTAPSGQTYTVEGTWGIRATEHKTSLAGASAILPFMYAENLTAGSQNLPMATDPITWNFALDVVVDRGTKFILNGMMEWLNDSAAQPGIQFFLGYSIDNGSTKSAGAYSQRTYSQDARRYIHINMREFYLSASPTAPVLVKLYWGFRGTQTDQQRSMQQFRRRMIALTSYAPDFDPDEGGAEDIKVAWTKYQKTKSSYRRTESGN